MIAAHQGLGLGSTAAAGGAFHLDVSEEWPGLARRRSHRETTRGRRPRHEEVGEVFSSWSTSSTELPISPSPPHWRIKISMCVHDTAATFPRHTAGRVRTCRGRVSGTALTSRRHPHGTGRAGRGRDGACSARGRSQQVFRSGRRGRISGGSARRRAARLAPAGRACARGTPPRPGGLLVTAHES